MLFRIEHHFYIQRRACKLARNHRYIITAGVRSANSKLFLERAGLRFEG